MKTPINREIIQNHMHYSWWKYLLLVVLAVFGWNLIYTTTAYRPPEEKKVNLIATCLGEQEKMDAYMEHIRQTQMSDMEDMSSIFMFMDETYGPMQLSTYIAAGEGDLYLLTKDEFQSYASQGAFVALDQLEGFIDYCDSKGFVVDKGWRTNTEIGEKHLYGIPMSNLPGLKQYFYTNEEYYLTIIVSNQNDVNVNKFMMILLEDMSVTESATPTDLASATDAQ